MSETEDLNSQNQNNNNKKEDGISQVSGSNCESPAVASVTQTKFYEKNWFMWLMLVVFAPVGIFILWKYHHEIKKRTKIILTVVFVIWFLCAVGVSSTGTKKTETYSSNSPIESSQTKSEKSATQTESKKADVKVVDFSAMDKQTIQSWCNENKIKCSFTEDYSDSVSKGSFISQSVAPDNTVKEGDSVKIVFSLGKKPTTEETNALKKAESYSSTMHMSKQGIYDQLTSEYGEKFPAQAAQYAIDNISADWNANALAKAKSYQKTMNMSKSAIYDQLTSEYGEKFTSSEAQYAIDNLD